VRTLERNALVLSVVLLIVGLGIGAGLGYTMAPTKTETITQTVTVEKIPLKDSEIKIGYIASSTSGLETSKPYIEEIVVPDHNALLQKLGYNAKIRVFIDNANEQSAIHLEKVQAFKAQGINIFLGGGWSSMASAALPYVNQNNMLMWSSSSTSPLLRIKDDNLFRMCPDDTVQAPAIAEMLWSFGIKAIVLIQRGDAWADGIYNILEKEYPAKGGVIIERIRYATDVTEYSSYLQTAETKAKDAVAQYGADHVGIELIAFETDSVTILTQAKDYPTIYNLKWFGSDGTTLLRRLVNEAPEQAAHVGLYSTLASPAESPKYKEIWDRYQALVKLPLSYYSACEYDIFTVLTNSITMAQSTDVKTILPLQIPTAYNLWGVSGWCRLNESGDRAAGNYDIWGYGVENGQTVFTKPGLYDGTSGKVTWYTSILGFTPPGP